MEKRLHQLETFAVHGEDGAPYVVRGYEHLSRMEGGAGLGDLWEPTGVAEYRLSNGEPVVVGRDGAMSLASSGLRLIRGPAPGPTEQLAS